MSHGTPTARPTGRALDLVRRYAPAVSAALIGAMLSTPLHAPTASARHAPPTGIVSLQSKDEFRGPGHPDSLRHHANRMTLGEARAPAPAPLPFDREAEAKATVERHHGAIREVPSPFPGSTLFEPTGPSKGAAIMVLHGSEGGNTPYSLWQAADLAAHGYAALAFSYFDVPGSSIPKKLVDIPIERTQAAADWLKARYGKVGLDGVSRGGEQALELASLDPNGTRFAAVAGDVPSSQINGAWDQTKERPIYDAHHHIRSAWTVGGKPLPEGQKIAIEKYPRPIFLLGAGKDSVWPSAQYVRELEHRLEAHGRRAEVHIFPNEDHIPSTKAWPVEEKMLIDFFDRALAR